MMVMSNFSVSKIRGLPHPIQNGREWLAYLEFIEAYFMNREIKKPIVVEVGAAYGHQKAFYEKLIDCEYIGIDIKHKTDIVGDSKSPETLNRLKEKLRGRPINLLFIDGDHSYSGVKSDYEMYAPLVRNIVAFHDVIIYKNAVAKLWNELIAANKEIGDKTFITIRAWHGGTFEMGTGIILLEK